MVERTFQGTTGNRSTKRRQTPGNRFMTVTEMPRPLEEHQHPSSAGVGTQQRTLQYLL